MKRLAIIISMTAFVAFSSFSQDTGARELLSKQEIKKEIFNTILNDHQLMTEFMEAMQENEHAMAMMKERNQMMGDDELMYMHRDSHMRSAMRTWCDQESMHPVTGHMRKMQGTDSTWYRSMPHMAVRHTETAPWCIR
ncbi:MAG: hypothetical protein R6U78_08170 [Bacteroidales bacterium]